MRLLYFKYSNGFIVTVSSSWDKIFGVDLPDTALYIVTITGIIALFVLLLAGIQSYMLRKIRRILSEKEVALREVEKHKSELENRAKDINDSLNYAQRIQEALLPSENYFKNYFRESFIYFKPKDIVSGDFYWIGEKGDKVFIAAADCTGHGVPGALMSMIGIEIIEKTINVNHIEKPSKILSVLNKELEKTFSREKNIGTIIRDGMDIGLCVVDRKLKKLEYSGAFFPLYLIRDNTLVELKDDKLIIGMNPSDAAYTNHEIDLKEGDMFYIFSDGYPDQFGGSANKKFMYRRFRYLLMTIHDFPVADQKAILEDNMRNWMNGNIQVDDMMVIGFRPWEKKPKKIV